MSVDFSRLFVVLEGWRRTALRVDQVDGSVDLHAVQAGRVRPEAPLEFRRDSGSRPMDLAGTTAATKLFSERFVRVLADLGATGWAAYRARVAGKDGRPVPGYSALAALGRAGPLDPSQGRLVAVPPPVPAGRVTYEERGWAFDPASWDGSDVFAPEGVRAVCVTDRVRDALEAAGVTNVQFQPFTDGFLALHGQPPPGRAVAAG